MEKDTVVVSLGNETDVTSEENSGIIFSVGPSKQESEDESKNIRSIDVKENSKNESELHKINLDVENAAKNDIPNSIDFDPESLALEKKYFMNYSKDEEQEKNMLELEEKNEMMIRQHLTEMTCLHNEMHALKQQNMQLNIQMNELISRTQNTSKNDKSNEGNRTKLSEGMLLMEIEKLKKTLLFHKQQKKTLQLAIEESMDEARCDGKQVQKHEKASCDSIIINLNKTNNQNLVKIRHLRDELQGALNKLPLTAFIKSTPLLEPKRDSTKCQQQLLKGSTSQRKSEFTQSK